MEGMRFSDLHVFPYSRRPGTSAVYRRTRGRSCQEGQDEAGPGSGAPVLSRIQVRSVGNYSPGTWEGSRSPDAPGTLSGLTDNYIRVECAREATAEATSGRSEGLAIPLLLPASLSCMRTGSWRNHYSREVVEPFPHFLKTTALNSVLPKTTWR